MPQSPEILGQWSGSTMSEAVAIESTSEAGDNVSTRQAVDNDYKSRGLADSHDNSDFDSDKEMTSLVTDALVSYSMENLMTDLAASQWRESWAWSRNVKEIVIVYLTQYKYNLLYAK
ncbi:uncharacterized protein LOC107270242 [Cephus cinctus]|uniref:Uncharacterized protein LOC107270242 n=1 Tax=Cephus cinctus TaxID=211228 RepID=A0AAJ7C2S0_CEPCN|nr:uncharacterized protein LOC107270242 [Cephus cinctus]